MHDGLVIGDLIDTVTWWISLLDLNEAVQLPIDSSIDNEAEHTRGSTWLIIAQCIWHVELKGFKAGTSQEPAEAFHLLSAAVMARSNRKAAIVAMK